MKQVNVPFYEADPPIWKTAAWLVYGNTVGLAPGVLAAALTDGWTAAGAAAVGYGALAVGLFHPKTRPYAVKGYRLFLDKFWLHLHGRKLSRVLRETLEHAGLVVHVQHERALKDGRMKRETVTYLPGVKVRLDETNYYVTFRMLPGQTEKQWENRVDAFAHALGCSLVASRIERGKVELTLQHGELEAPGVAYKTDEGHTLAIGYGVGGLVEWDFDQFPHALIVGPTGTGKSTFMRNLLIQLRKEWTVKIADGKQVEFSALARRGFDVAADVEGFVRLVDEAQGEVEKRFRRMKDEGRNNYREIGLEPYFLIVDEAIYLLEALDDRRSKEKPQSDRERIMNKIRDISLRGRAAGVFLVLIFQRPDSTVMPTIIRDNLMAKVCLGGSETALEMCFGKERSKTLDPVKPGYGYVAIGDEVPRLFRFPDYSQEKFLADMDNRERDMEGTRRGLSGKTVLIGRARQAETATRAEPVGVVE